VRLIAEGRGEREHPGDHRGGRRRVRSFCNHFPSKEQLFEAASAEVLERWGQMIDHQRPRRGVIHAPPGPPGGWAGHIPTSPASSPGAALDALGAPGGQAPRALRDIQAGQAAGRFTIPSVELALAAVAGDLLGLLWLHQRHPDRIAQTSVDRLAEATLRLLDVPAAEAARLVTLPLEHQELVPLPVTVPPGLLDCRADVRCDYLRAALVHMRGAQNGALANHTNWMTPAHPAPRDAR